jgi:hypothetical protein
MLGNEHLWLQENQTLATPKMHWLQHPFATRLFATIGNEHNFAAKSTMRNQIGPIAMLSCRCARDKS